MSGLPASAANTFSSPPRATTAPSPVSAPAMPRTWATGGAIDIPQYQPPTLTYSDGKHAASEMSAQLTRAQWDEWKTSGAPFEEWLQQQTSYMNPGLVADLSSRALDTSGRAYMNFANQGLQRMRDIGAPVSAAVDAANQRSIGINKSVAAVDAANRIVQRIKGRDVEIASGAPAAPVSASGGGG